MRYCNRTLRSNPLPAKSDWIYITMHSPICVCGGNCPPVTTSMWVKNAMDVERCVVFEVHDDLPVTPLRFNFHTRRVVAHIVSPPLQYGVIMGNGGKS